MDYVANYSNVRPAEITSRPREQVATTGDRLVFLHPYSSLHITLFGPLLDPACPLVLPRPRRGCAAIMASWGYYGPSARWDLIALFAFIPLCREWFALPRAPWPGAQPSGAVAQTAAKGCARNGITQAA